MFLADALIHGGDPEFVADDDDTLKEIHRTLVDKIYAGAVDPSGYQDLLQTWDAHFEQLGQLDQRYQQSDFSWTGEWIGHFNRAGDVFDTLERANQPSLADKLAASSDLALLIDQAGRIVEMSPPAVRDLSCRENGLARDLPFDATSHKALAALRHQASTAPEEGHGRHVLLRYFASDDAVPIIFLADIVVEARCGTAYVLLRSSNAAWHPNVAEALQTGFGLTNAETRLVQHLYLGHSVKQIAERLGKSQATLRTQLSAVLGKTGLKSQADLARAVSGLTHTLHQPDLAEAPGPVAPQPEPSIRQRERVLRLNDDVTVHIVESGCLDGAPCMFLQTTTWPTLTPDIVTALAAEGHRLLAPYRSGLGQTTQMPVSFGPKDWAKLYVTMLDALEIDRVLVGGHCSGGIYALHLAEALGCRCDGVILTDTGAPLRNARMINQMSLAPRRLFLAARYFPLALRTPYKL
ncbi:MAG: alpha/beta fold hydrolase, partial [Pseudomonadota bacterium]